MTARTPEQDEAPRTAEEDPAGSRQVRRRLTFGVAGDIADLPAALSPWQRAYEAWRAAGLTWGHGAPPRERAKPAAAPEPAAPKPAAKAPKAAKPPRPKPAKPAKSAKPAKPDPGDVLVAGPPKPLPPTPQKPVLWRRLRVRAAVGVALVVVAAGTIVVVAQREDAPAEPGIPGPVAADGMFALDPAAASDGLVQDLTAVASAGATIVAAGTEGTGAPAAARARFLTSTDAGRAWTLAEIRTPDGAAPAPGEAPRLVAGAAGHWAALGRTPAGAAIAWTSKDAKTWSRHPAGAAFTPADQVTGLARTAQGFLAVGAAKGRAVTWASADGRTWQRGTVPAATRLDAVAASGGVVVAHGTTAKKVVKKRGRKKVTRTVVGEGLWRSADGGRTWAAATVPQAQGSYGPAKGLTAGPGGFAAVREGRQTTGSKKRRKTTRFGVVFTSPDGLKWQAVSRFPGGGIERFGGTPDGLAAIVRGAKGAHTILRSTDGRTWRPGGSIPAPVRGSGLTVAAGGALAVSGRQGDDAYLHGVDLDAVPGAVNPERSVRSIAASPAMAVAVGSTNGAAAIWTAPDGLRWARAQVPPGRWLTDAVHGSRGWAAVGRTAGAVAAPLVLTSQDGQAWQKVAFPAGPVPVAVAAGPSGYVAVGPRTAWRSADLRTWSRAVLDGVPADVAAADGAYVAVGARGKAPAIWTSPDGVKWTAAKPPPAFTAPLTGVAAHGRTLVALSASATALVSTDAGATWTQRNLGPGLTAAAVTATPQGFVVTADTGGDAAVLTSPDGTTWRRLGVAGLSGHGEQRLTALTTLGANLLATGTDEGTPTLWRTPVPK
ncbi:hypothetical protein AB0K34_32595 [Actinomadura sp. NPDC049382]|uniref:hypothetical protein n=1 Tax=Actinomadura sp. NPDC049382 TaxID=3158220 RepID=UPI00343A5E34